MSDDYYIRLLPFILQFSREFLALKGLDNVSTALILDDIFRRITGISPLDKAGCDLKGGENF